MRGERVNRKPGSRKIAGRNSFVNWPTTPVGERRRGLYSGSLVNRVAERACAAAAEKEVVIPMVAISPLSLVDLAIICNEV